jgi:hypothetical protein
MTSPNAPIPARTAPNANAGPASPPPSRLPSYPRQTEDGYYGPRRYGPNACALVAFILSLAGGSLVAGILALVALGRIRDTGQSGRGLAIAALVLSVLGLPIEIYLILRRSSGA